MKTKTTQKKSNYTPPTTKPRFGLQRKFALQHQIAGGKENASGKPAPLLQPLPGSARVSAAPPGVQPRLTVGPSNDKYEQETDQMADRVMRMTDADLAGPAVQGQSAPRIQMKAAPGGLKTVDPQTASAVQALRGGGSPLPDSARSFMEPRFGRDFSKVRVHTDAKAQDTARSLNARAFTLGRDIVFGAGQYSPDSSEGRKLLAHELTHTVQQGAGGGPERTHQIQSPKIIPRIRPNKIQRKTNDSKSRVRRLNHDIKTMNKALAKVEASKHDQLIDSQKTLLLIVHFEMNSGTSYLELAKKSGPIGILAKSYKKIAHKKKYRRMHVAFKKLQERGLAAALKPNKDNDTKKWLRDFNELSAFFYDEIAKTMQDLDRKNYGKSDVKKLMYKTIPLTLIQRNVDVLSRDIKIPHPETSTREEVEDIISRDIRELNDIIISLASEARRVQNTNAREDILRSLEDAQRELESTRGIGKDVIEDLLTIHRELIRIENTIKREIDDSK